MPTRTLAAALVVLSLAGTTSATTSASAAQAAKPKNPSGAYAGTEVPEQDPDLDDIVFTFDVKNAGRKITGFTVAMNVVCSGFPIYIEYVVQPMNPMKVNPRTGRFKDVVTGATEGGTTYRVEVAGKLKGTKVTGGTMSYDVGVCQRGTDGDPVGWKASRQRR